MKTLALTLTALTTLSLTACQTTAGSGGDDALFGGISADKISPVVSSETAALSGVSVPGVSAPGVSVSGLSGIDGLSSPLSPAATLAETAIRNGVSNETCTQFNVNSLALAAKPEGAGFGLNLFKVIALGTVAGAASGGVAALGIGSAFVETAVAGTVNQVVYNGAQPVVNKALPGGASMAAKAEKIYAAADRLSCPHPTWIEGLTNKDAAALLAKQAAERKVYDTAGVSSTVTYADPVDSSTVTSPSYTVETPAAPAAPSVDCTGLSDAQCIAKVNDSFG